MRVKALYTVLDMERGQVSEVDASDAKYKSALDAGMLEEVGDDVNVTPPFSVNLFRPSNDAAAAAEGIVPPPVPNAQPVVTEPAPAAAAESAPETQSDLTAGL
jgi:hypothetical protein